MAELEAALIGLLILVGVGAIVYAGMRPSAPRAEPEPAQTTSAEDGGADSTN